MELMRTQWRRGLEDKGEAMGASTWHLSNERWALPSVTTWHTDFLSQHTIHFNLMNSSLPFKTFTSQEK